MTWLDNAKIKTAEDKAVEAEKAKESEFKSKRKEKVDSATVTTTAGNVYDANEISITRMHECLQAIERAAKRGFIQDINSYKTKWVLADSPPGIATEVTYDELEEAFIAACDLRAANWERKE